MSNTKTLLSSLSITTRSVTAGSDPLVHRQNKLIGRLEVQREMAQCLLENTTFTIFKEKLVVDPDPCEKSKVRVPKQVKAWFYVVKGDYCIDVCYRSKLSCLNCRKAKAVCLLVRKRN